VASSLDICKSRYNNAESDGYKAFHVTKVLRGREKNEEREGSERFVCRPAAVHVSRGNSSLAARVLALGRRFPLRLDPVSPLSFAPNQLLPAPNQALPRQIPGSPLKIERSRVKSPNPPKIEPPLKNPRVCLVLAPARPTNLRACQIIGERIARPQIAQDLAKNTLCRAMRTGARQKTGSKPNSSRGSWGLPKFWSGQLWPRTKRTHNIPTPYRLCQKYYQHSTDYDPLNKL
jgi:hypothetical protein